MPAQQTYESEHSVRVLAPARTLFDIVTDVVNWPRVLPPMVHVEPLTDDGSDPAFQVWATAKDEIRSWVSGHEADRDRLVVAFRQRISPPPLASMNSVWSVDRVSDEESVVRIHHEFRLLTDDPAATRWIRQAIHHNSEHELHALKEGVERAGRQPDLAFSFEDGIEVSGALEDVYDFVRDAGEWPTRLPHVARVDLRETTRDVQVLEMDTRAVDGSTHTTRSVRVCFPHEKIVYKQQVLPWLLTVHTGQWLFTRTAAGVSATSRHTVVINPDAVTPVLGQDATLADARAFVRRAVGANSAATLQHAKEYAERRAGLRVAR
ncbi:aromatase [Streptoalloteichus tenebrarius]|uniref:Aromatase n=1 Tax=Streptoalloteichus tenebrarius (strain ATCC 17920 / DSM 40477 / JCM 4838 / CBS 697.72 / NBRC 16177 / NCIMB 11028 / NRRL B-12390 / A12253. 1 / ISP 5477) TaxID=1933 RepID=A0ABT1HXN7_STRSD|nr:aromatase/cyclase [Streptoalloteichus tenebrarius]MCP2260265.1 aromatase [Streptoalloteichus tenebrarius]BFF03015.1 SRPBCC family protein [Streptoalloteichus tenebrarius]